MTTIVNILLISIKRIFYYIGHQLISPQLFSLI